MSARPDASRAELVGRFFIAVERLGTECLAEIVSRLESGPDPMLRIAPAVPEHDAAAEEGRLSSLKCSPK